MNPINEIGHVVKVAAVDVAHVAVDVVEFLPKAEKVIADAIKDQPEVKSSVISLVAQAEAVIASVTVAAAGKGINLAADATALAQAESFFDWFRDSFIPAIAKVYDEVATDVK